MVVFLQSRRQGRAKTEKSPPLKMTSTIVTEASGTRSDGTDHDSTAYNNNFNEILVSTKSDTRSDLNDSSYKSTVR